MWFRSRYRSLRIGKNGSSESYSTKNEIFFPEKIEKNTNISQELWKDLKSLVMKSGKVNQSKIALKSDGAIQFDPMKTENICKDFYSDLTKTN